MGIRLTKLVLACELFQTAMSNKYVKQLCQSAISSSYVNQRFRQLVQHIMIRVHGHPLDENSFCPPPPVNYVNSSASANVCVKQLCQSAISISYGNQLYQTAMSNRS